MALLGTKPDAQLGMKKKKLQGIAQIENIHVRFRTLIYHEILEMLL